MITRTRLGRAAAVALSFALPTVATPARAATVSNDGHLVGMPLVAERLAAKAAEREAQVRSIEEALALPAAQSQARALGVDVDKLRSAVPHLTDAELADLGKRAANVQDLAAGHHHDDGLVIAAVVILIVALVVLLAVAAGNNYDDCGCYY